MQIHFPRCLVPVAIEGAPEQKTKNVKTCDRLGPFTGGYVLTFLGLLWHYLPPAAAHPCADLEFLSNSCFFFLQNNYFFLLNNEKCIFYFIKIIYSKRR